MVNIQKAMPVSGGSEPKEGRRSLAFTIPHSSVQTYSAQFEMSQPGLFSGVLGVFIDNSNNSATLSFKTAGLNQTLAVPPYSQATFPILNNGPNFSYTSASPGAVDVPIQLLNFEPDMNVWSVNPGSALGTVVVSGTVTVSPLAGVVTEKNGSIAAAGVAQTLAAANGSRKRLIIENPATAAGQGIAAIESLFIRFTNAAGVDVGTSLELTPGGIFDTGTGPCPTALVSVNAATSGHKYVAIEIA